MRDTDTSKKVMDRIMSENRWTQPVHEHEKSMSKRLKGLGIVLSILLLLGISVSFIFIHPVFPDNDSDVVVKGKYGENIVTIVKSTDFAKTYTDLDFMFIQKGTVASIGEPLVYHPEDGDETSRQLFWMIAIFGISLITLFSSWISNNQK